MKIIYIRALVLDNKEILCNGHIIGEFDENFNNCLTEEDFESAINELKEEFKPTPEENEKFK